MITEITNANFSEEVEASGLPVLLDFWAAWCGPCRMLSPVVDELAEQYDGTVKFGKVNVDEQPQLAMKFGIESIPMLIFFKNGKPVDASVGVVPKEQIEAMISK